jgi:hypothetical protein
MHPFFTIVSFYFFTYPVIIYQVVLAVEAVEIETKTRKFFNKILNLKLYFH